MHISDITAIGWLHSVTCVIALFAGAHNLVAEKGTPRHRAIGLGYFWTMIVLNVSSLAIYRFDIAQFRPFVAGPHIFGVFHWIAVATLVFVLVGRYAASHQDRALGAYAHPIAMILSYYMLVGGAINEAFARVDVLRALSHQSRFLHATPPIALTQTAWMAATFILILFFTAKVALYRRAARA